MFDYHRELVSQGKVVEKPLRTLRLKLHVPCQWGCHFCHMEGNHGSASIDDLDELLFVLECFREKLDISTVHLTGGEPSIHPNVVDWVRRLHGEGFEVKMTSNGVARRDIYMECVAAGLSGLNISIHTLDPEELGNLMEPVRSAQWGQESLGAQLSLCRTLASQIDMKINTCVSTDETQAIKIAAFAIEMGAHWRPMNQLEIPRESYAALRRMCETLAARPVEARVVRGSASFSIVMCTDDDFSFSVKLIRPFKLESMCAGCPLDAKRQCYEYAYGPRIEKDMGGLMVRNCLHRHGEPFVLSVHEFFRHEMFTDLHNAILE